MADPADFTKLVPGFDFLQNLVKNAGSALPNMGQWVAPTLSPEEIEKRIDELKTVQFWLEQNARMLAATIQALEVQRMTLATLETMNVQMGDLRDSLKIRVPPAAPAPAPAAPQAPAAAAEPRTETASRPAGEPEADPKGKGRPAVDPMQWWGALTKQFTELAASALQDGAAVVGKKSQAAPRGDGGGAARKEATGSPARKRVAAKKSAASPAQAAAPARKRTAPKR